jgi:HD-like signal output (HDOD) protein
MQSVDADSITIRISRNENLPVLPEVASAALRITDEANASARDLETLVEADTAITAKVLRVANSAYYGGHEVASIARAINVLGLNTVRTLILAVAYHNMLSGKPNCRLFSKPAFWRHSLAAATAARVLGRIRFPYEADALYCAGLLHDVGMLVFERFCPREFDYALDYATRMNEPLHVAERKVMGLDHAQVGGILADRWFLSGPLRSAIMHHHDPCMDTENADSTRLVALANEIARMAGFFVAERPQPESTASDLAEAAGIAPGQLGAIIEVVSDEVRRAESAFHLQAA